MWCLFEVYVAITEDVGVVVTLSENEEVGFQKALQKNNGLARVENALANLDARNASASVPDDKDLIMAKIEGGVGVEAFNERVRECMLAEFKRISTSAAMR